MYTLVNATIVALKAAPGLPTQTANTAMQTPTGTPIVTASVTETGLAVIVAYGLALASTPAMAAWGLRPVCV